ncbi:MAG: hypothetical protein A2Y66_01745 [Nitrospirae bacterium RBG_13_41_22]|nr:MAG: hypothetical protein A2Y66_01745 [Nitrospirae bacterium RBG_13_41_22]
MTKSIVDCAAEGGCEPVKELKNKVEDKDIGLSALNNKVVKRVSWASMGMIAAMFALTGIGLILWFGSIKAQSEEFPETKKDVQVLKEDMAVVKKQVESFDKWKSEDKELKKEIIALLDKIAKEKKAKN